MPTSATIYLNLRTGCWLIANRLILKNQRSSWFFCVDLAFKIVQSAYADLKAASLVAIL